MDSSTKTDKLVDKTSHKIIIANKKSFKFKKPSIINFIGNKSASNKTDLHFLNRKRVIQMLDIFNSKYDCKKCRKKLRYKADQIIHTKLKHQRSDFCNPLLTSVKHKRCDHLIKCPECDLQFKTYFSLTSHLKTVHLNERPYGCKICHKKFHAFVNLKRHCHKKHLNTESSPSSLLSPVSLSSSSSPSSQNGHLYNSISTENNNSNNNSNMNEKTNNLYDLIDYENSIFIQNEDVQRISVSSRSSEISSSSFSSSMSGSSTDFLPSLTKNPFSINSNSNIKYFNYINQVSKSEPMNIEPIIQYLDEEKSLEKEFKDKIIASNTFTIITQLNFVKCNLCPMKFATNSEYLSHVWRNHLNSANLNLQIFSNKIDKDMFYHMNSNNLYNNSDSSYTKTCWTCATTNTKENFKKITFNNVDLLISHIKDHLNESRLFKCSICPNLSFNSYETSKEHYLNKHIDKNEKENVRFVLACACCEQIYSSYNCILKHFELSPNCNLRNINKKPSTKIKCTLCKLEFNVSSIGMHLNQHKLLDMNKNRIDQINKSNSIKNSNNNKQYSIDAIVNSPVKLAKKTKLEDIASKISMKQQNTTPYQNYNAWTSFMHLKNTSDSPIQKNDTFSSNFNTLLDDFKLKYFNKQSNFNNDMNNFNLHTNQSLDHKLRPNTNTSPLVSSPMKTSNFNTSAFTTPVNNPNNANLPNSSSNSFLNNFNSQIFHLNKLYQQQTGFNNDSVKSFNFKSPMPTVNFMNQYNNPSNQNLSIQTSMPSSSSSSSLSSSSTLEAFNRNHSKSSNSNPSSLLGFKCEFCGYSYKSLADLLDHRSMHVSPNHKRPLRCHLCAINFAKTDQLMKHMIVHKDNGIDPICQICHATFARKQDLDRHMIFHSK